MSVTYMDMVHIRELVLTATVVSARYSDSIFIESCSPETHTSQSALEACHDMVHMFYRIWETLLNISPTEEQSANDSATDSAEVEQ
jgi:hypothetical protein